MFPYTPVQLIFFFFCYCFLGWIIESTWVSLHQKRFVNRGFMRGPFIPIYGFGAMALLLSCTYLLKWPVAVFFVGMIVASVLEYFTGVAMEAIFKVRYWDYSNKKFNINGHVCLFNSLCWGVLALGENYGIHKPIKALSEKMGDKMLNYVTMVIAIYFISDLTLAFKAAFDTRDLIIAMDKAKREMQNMHKRLDVLMAFAESDMDEHKDKIEARMSAVGERVDDIEERIEDISDSLGEKFKSLKERMVERPQAFAESVKDEYREMYQKYMERKSDQFGMNRFSDFYKRDIFRGNPGMVSKKFAGTVESIKAYMAKKRNSD